MHGYDACAGYHVLRSRASVDAESEIAHILRIFKEMSRRLLRRQWRLGHKFFCHFFGSNKSVPHDSVEL